MVNQLFLWPFWIAFCMFFGGSDPGYPKVDAPGWPRHPPPRWASSFPGVPCLHVYTHIPYNCWWYHWYPRKNLWNSMNLCLPRLLQSPFFCSSICHQSQTMFDDQRRKPTSHDQHMAIPVRPVPGEFRAHPLRTWWWWRWSLEPVWELEPQWTTMVQWCRASVS